MCVIRVRRLARLCYVLHDEEWILGLVNITAAVLFVVGSAVFFVPSLSSIAVGLFLSGSVLFLLGAAGDLFSTCGPAA